MRSDSVSSVVWFIFGTAIVYGSYQLKLGELTRPGPGFLTFWCGIILCIFAVVVFLQARIGGPGEGARKLAQIWMGLNWSKPLKIVLLMGIYALILTRVGFLASTTVLMFFLFKAIDPVKWWVAIGAAVLASLVSFVAFDMGFQVQLPHSFLEMFVLQVKQSLFR